MILVLDVADVAAAVRLHNALQGYFTWIKVGLELFSAVGPEVFRHIPAKRTFLDVKYHDIPNTVRGASRSAAGHGVWMFNVHCHGGFAMMQAARQGADEGADQRGIEPPLVLGVTVLSSLDEKVLREELGVGRLIEDQVVTMARLAQDAGLSGVVASAPEVARIREACGPDFVIMTPGIRPAGAPMGDQKRVMTPAEAIRAGSTYLGIGRAVTAAPDPSAAAQAVLDEVAASL